MIPTRSGITSGCIMSPTDQPEWDRVLSAAAHLQRIIPDAVLVGGTAAATHVQHRLSHDADHVLTDLRTRFDAVLAELESVAGWKTARINRPVQILGSLDGIETGVRQLIRQQPLETMEFEHHGQSIVLPTKAEMLRIKAALILKRNATRDYLDFVALSDQLGKDGTVIALKRFDELYPQPNGESPLQQLQIQLANPMPYDLDELKLEEYRNLTPQWHNWSAVKEHCARRATALFDALARDQ
ncbi:MAG: hypothetical protein JO353_09190 [Phycisphaerae bacterium]|nr:hypothetical protein [Phycisphaerae bacterium]